MPYELTSIILREYIHDRLVHPTIPSITTEQARERGIIRPEENLSPQAHRISALAVIDVELLNAGELKVVNYKTVIKLGGKERMEYECVYAPRLAKGRGNKPDRISIGLNPEGLDTETSLRFLSQYVDTDHIFEKGQPLYSPERQVALPEWKKVLQRHPSKKSRSSKNPEVSCDILDPKISTERLKRIIYEYMFRPVLWLNAHRDLI